MLVAAEKEEDIETYLRLLGEHFEGQSVDVLIDLYVDDEGELKPNALSALADLRARAREREGRRKRGWFARLMRQSDAYMGFPLSMSDQRDRLLFSRLAHQVIGCEAWRDREQIFSASGANSPLWVSLGRGEELRLLRTAQKAGGITLREVQV